MSETNQSLLSRGIRDAAQVRAYMERNGHAAKPQAPVTEYQTRQLKPRTQPRTPRENYYAARKVIETQKEL